MSTALFSIPVPKRVFLEKPDFVIHPELARHRATMSSLLETVLLKFYKLGFDNFHLNSCSLILTKFSRCIILKLHVARLFRKNMNLEIEASCSLPLRIISKGRVHQAKLSHLDHQDSRTIRTEVTV